MKFDVLYSLYFIFYFHCVILGNQMVPMCLKFKTQPKTKYFKAKHFFTSHSSFRGFFMSYLFPCVESTLTAIRCT